jgi:hypothetical protein
MMSTQEKNKMIYILKRRKVSRDGIKWIMEDLEKSEIFNDGLDDYDDIYWEDLEQEADWMFSDAKNSEKIGAIRKIREGREEIKKEKINNFEEKKEQKIKQKIKEMIEKGLVKKTEIKEREEECVVYTRYGRSPLHEAIAMKDINLVLKYVQEGKYNTLKDNNGHTPVEMAKQENYLEAIELFKKYISHY